MNLERRFSQEYAQGERDALAAQLRQTRERRGKEWSEFTEEEVKGLDTPELLETYRTLKRDFLGRIFKMERHTQEQEKWGNLLEKRGKKDIESQRKDFQKKLEAVLSATPLTPEEQEQYLSEEALKQMTLPDYLLLMQRLSGNYVSHVTRYGVREQTFMSTGGGHTSHEGEFIDNFTPILKEKQLHSFFTSLQSGTEYAKRTIQKAIQTFVENTPQATKEEVIEAITTSLLRDSSPFGDKEVDRSGVHVATGDVAARFYGSEHQYDIYFYYPAEAIAKNYLHDTSVAEPHGTDWYNDTVIWNSGKGIPVDAGICCIPENATVDKETGSQYQLNNEHEPIVDPSVQEHLDYYREHFKMFDKTIADLWRRESNNARQDPGSIDKDWTTSLCLASEELHFPDVHTFTQFYDEYKNISMSNPLKDFYTRHQRYYLAPPAERKILSKDYWEKYFTEHQDERPKKILYYHKGYHFTTSPDRQPGKQEVMESLDAQTNVPGNELRQRPVYRTYREEVDPQIRQAVAEAYDAVKKS